MDRELIERFLLKSTIPEAPKNTHENKRLWDAIWRAHRDVLTGRFYLKKYCGQSKNDAKDGTKDDAKNNTNLVAEELYHLIAEKKPSEKLSSEKLICSLETQSMQTDSKFKDVEFGAIQKLVNMSLKYIIILNEFENTNWEVIPVDETACDCPLDSIILSQLKKDNGKSHTGWTKIEKEEYKKVQQEIKNELEKQGKGGLGNLYYDFMNW